MTTQHIPVTGLTCAHCVAAVTEEVTALPGVHRVSVALVPDGVSTVTVEADREVGAAELAGALDEAGDYHMTAGAAPRP